MSLPPAAANVRAAALGLRWNFPNNYTLSKHLAEQLVAQHQQQGLPACIVRPSLVCAVLYEPVPGHVVGPVPAHVLHVLLYGSCF
jgi:nucleoside-diphosphate-sugar epimerase